MSPEDNCPYRPRSVNLQATAWGKRWVFPATPGGFMAPCPIDDEVSRPREGLVLGPIADSVLTEAVGPVVLVRPERGDVAWSLQRLLLAHDGTPTATAALRPATLLGTRAGARVWAVHVGQARAAPPCEPGSFPAPRYVDQQQHEWPAWTREFASSFATGCAPGLAQPELTLEAGEPASNIVRFAAEHAVDLVALAWRGSLDAERALALKAVLRDASCPTMIRRAA